MQLGILNSQLFRNVVEIVKNAIQRPYFVNKVNTYLTTYIHSFHVLAGESFEHSCLIVCRRPVWNGAHFGRTPIAKLLAKRSKFRMGMAATMRIMKSHVKKEILELANKKGMMMFLQDLETGGFWTL